MKENDQEKKLSLFDSTAIIIGSMIGSGIFIVSAEIARKVETPGMLLLAWVITGIITIMLITTAFVVLKTSMYYL